MNVVWLEIVLLAHDLIIWTQALCLDGELAKAEPKRLRYRLLHIAAHLAFHGRQRKLHLPKTWPWTEHSRPRSRSSRCSPLPPAEHSPGDAHPREQTAQARRPRSPLPRRRRGYAWQPLGAAATPPVTTTSPTTATPPENPGGPRIHASIARSGLTPPPGWGASRRKTPGTRGRTVRGR